MGTGNESKKRPGDPLRFDAQTWNSVVDMLREWKRTRDGNDTGAFSSLIESKLCVMIENFTAEALPVYSVLNMSGMSVSPTDKSKYTFNIRPCVGGFTPDAANNFVGILQQPSDGSTSRGLKACIRGVTFCLVKMNDVSHRWANPVPGVTEYLESVDCGQARILDFIPVPVAGGSGSGGGGSGSGGSYGYYGSSDIYLALVDLIGSCTGGGSGSDVSYLYGYSVSLPYYFSSPGSWEYPGIRVTLPEAGTYIVSGTCSVNGTINAIGNGAYCAMRLWSETDGNTLEGVAQTGAGGSAYVYILSTTATPVGGNLGESGSGTMVLPVTVTRATEVRIQAIQGGSATYTGLGLNVIRGHVSYTKIG